MNYRVLAAAIAFAFSGQSAAALNIKFEAYEGAPQIVTGVGGTRVSVDGVDFWTSGTPPHRYQVIGYLRDVRKEGLITKSAIGSPAIAKRVAAAGGNALIVDGQDVRTTGFVGGSNSYGSGNNAYASGYATAIEKTSTRMVVVKYLDAQ